MVFVDTSAFLAIENHRDARHEEALALRRRVVEAGRLLVTSDYVLDESYTIIRHRAGHRVAVDFGEGVRISRGVRIEYVTLEVIEQGWAIFKRFADKEFSFTDCTSFALMRKLGLREALAFDGHFAQAGFLELRP
jgi:predicted nucleic acid-binding protein